MSANAAVPGTAAFLHSGLTISRYLNPDLLYSGNAELNLDYFTNADYGSFTKVYLNNGFYYELSENMNLGLNLGIESFADSINDNANYFSYTLTPRISYSLSPVTIIGIISDTAHTNYLNTDSSLQNMRKGGYFTHQLLPGLLISLSLYNLDSVATTTSLNYSGTLTHIGVNYSISNNFCLFIWSCI